MDAMKAGADDGLVAVHCYQSCEGGKKIGGMNFCFLEIICMLATVYGPGTHVKNIYTSIFNKFNARHQPYRKSR